MTRISWDDVVAESERFVTSDHQLIPFKVVDLNKKADALDEEHILACGPE